MATTGFNAGLDSSDVILSYLKESTYATVASGQFQKLRMTGEGFSETKDRTRPVEIDARGQAAAAITTQQQAQGSINFGVSYGTFDDLLQSLLMAADWSSAITMTETTIAATDDTGGGNPGYTDSGNGFVTAGFQPGMWVKVSGFTGSPDVNNGYRRIISVAAGTIEVDGAGSENMATEGAGDSVTIRNDGMIRNASVVQTFTVQKQMASSLFFYYPGSYPISGTLNANVGGYFEGSMNFIAKSEQSATSNQATGSPDYLEAPTGKIIDTIGGIQSPQVFNGTSWESLTESGGTYDTVLQGLSLDISKEQARLQFGIGSSSAGGMARGTLTLGGTASMYFKNFALYNLYANETSVRIAVRALDSAGKGYVITLPGVTLMNPNIVAGSANTDLVAEFNLEGNPATVENVSTPFTIQLDRFAA